MRRIGRSSICLQRHNTMMVREYQRWRRRVEILVKKFKAMSKKAKTKTQRKELSTKYHREYDKLLKEHKKKLDEITNWYYKCCNKRRGFQ